MVSVSSIVNDVPMAARIVLQDCFLVRQLFESFPFSPPTNSELTSHKPKYAAGWGVAPLLEMTTSSGVVGSESRKPSIFVRVK